MTHGDFKDLTKRTASDKVACDKAFDISKNLKHDRYYIVLASMVYKVFVKKIVTYKGTGIILPQFLTTYN